MINVGSLEKLIISGNFVSYYEPGIWKGFTALRNVDIAKNKLSDQFSTEDYARSVLL